MSIRYHVSISKKKLLCSFCDRDIFFQRLITLDTMTLEGGGVSEKMFGRESTLYVCSNCGNTHIFEYLAKQPRAELIVASKDSGQECACLSCGSSILEGSAECEKCGWTWASSDEASGST